MAVVSFFCSCLADKREWFCDERHGYADDERHGHADLSIRGREGVWVVGL